MESYPNTAYDITSGQRCYVVMAVIFMVLSILTAIGNIVLSPITYVRVVDSRDEIQTLKDVFNITDDSILVSDCGTIDLIARNITIKSRMELNDEYQNSVHFSKKSSTDIGRIQLGPTNATSTDERAKNVLIGATSLHKMDYGAQNSIGYVIGSFSDTESRCNKNSGTFGAGKFFSYVLVDTKQTSEAEIYLCFCMQVGQSSSPWNTVFPNTYRANDHNNLECVNAGSDRPSTYNDLWQERCIAQKFCYNWYADNYNTTSGSTVPLYNKCSYIPKI